MTSTRYSITGKSQRFSFLCLVWILSHPNNSNSYELSLNLIIYFFIDNLLYDEGKKQEYGTRIDMKSGNPALYPSNNPEKLNERRAAMNLGTINSYLDKLGLTYLYAPKKKAKAIKPKALKTKKVSVKKPVTTTTEKPRHLIIN
jgi:hypothetical protein